MQTLAANSILLFWNDVSGLTCVKNGWGVMCINLYNQLMRWESKAHTASDSGTEPLRNICFRRLTLWTIYMNEEWEIAILCRVRVSSLRLFLISFSLIEFFCKVGALINVGWKI